MSLPPGYATWGVKEFFVLVDTELNFTNQAQYFSQPFPKPGRKVFTLLCRYWPRAGSQNQLSSVPCVEACQNDLLIKLV